MNIATVPLAVNSITPSGGVNGGSYTLKLTTSSNTQIDSNMFASNCKLETKLASAFPIILTTANVMFFKIYYDGSNYYINIEKYL